MNGAKPAQQALHHSACAVVLWLRGQSDPVRFVCTQASADDASTKFSEGYHGVVTLEAFSGPGGNPKDRLCRLKFDMSTVDCLMVDTPRAIVSFGPRDFPPMAGQ